MPYGAPQSVGQPAEFVLHTACARWRDAVERIVRWGQRQGVFRDDVDPARVAMRLTALTDGMATQVLTGTRLVGDRDAGLLVDFVRHELVAEDGHTMTAR
ncbi:TetR family transcriptional regulator C-terminal domain-containing protein [Amycolatopsis sp. NPDC059090]|uniref:TetR family transcriptional regulator C-terminal domain-containing protein n=1 Tax=Amycolatopsis sp. NPDC059090 TaxID=3346723 RepID=UPI00366D0026